MFVLLSVSLWGQGREDGLQAYRRLFTLPVQGKTFTTDRLLQAYVLTEDNVVEKYTAEGMLQFTFPNRTMGDAAFLDATNPFHLLLFFPGHQVVQLMDRTMNPVVQFNLFRYGIFQSGAVGMSGDGKLWVYDETGFRLRKLQSDGTMVLEGNDMSLLLREGIRPVSLVERDQLVYVNDPAVGILVFDVFGRYQRTIPLSGIRDFQVMDDRLVYLRDGKLYSYHLRLMEERGVSMPADVGEVKAANVQQGRLYLMGKDSLWVYGF
jgi:hypothetical protein